MTLTPLTLLRLVLPCMVLVFFATPAQARQLRLVFTGDIMAHAEQLKGAFFGADFAKAGDEDFDFSHQFATISPYLKGDIVIGNFETVLAGPEKPYTGYPNFHAPDALADALTNAGFTTLLLANNHIFDKGAQAAIRTRDVLQDKGFAVTGLFSPAAENTPLILEAKGIRLGLINYTYGSNVPVSLFGQTDVTLNVIDKPRIMQDILFLRKNNVDFIMALFHFGVEYQQQPSQYQKDVAAFCQILGVDLLVGTHPHILQPMEWLPAPETTPALPVPAEYLMPVSTQPENTPFRMENVFPHLPLWTGKKMFVAWSLGNFVSYQRTTPRERSAVLAVDITRPLPVLPPVISRVSIMPTWVRNTKVAHGAGTRQHIEILPLTDTLLEENPTLAPIRESILTLLPAQKDTKSEFYTVWQ